MLNRLVDLGNTVIVVEHNMDVIKTADWIIDLGPEAGDAGGYIVAEGTPEDVVAETRRQGDKETRRQGESPTSPHHLTTSPPHQVSHTAAILSYILAAGPHAERTKYDPYAAETVHEGDVALETVGHDAKMPWETDGRRWHMSDRITHKGVPARWEGGILDWIDQRIHELGAFSDTNWNHRSVIEITGPAKSHGWFFHAHTGLERYVRLVFRVSRNSFRPVELREQLGIKRLNELEGLDVYGDEQRVPRCQSQGALAGGCNPGPSIG